MKVSNQNKPKRKTAKHGRFECEASAMHTEWMQGCAHLLRLLHRHCMRLKSARVMISHLNTEDRARRNVFSFGISHGAGLSPHLAHAG